MGRTPGFLLRAIRRHASRGAVVDGSIRLVQSLWAEMAMEWHRSFEAPLKDVQSLLQQAASRPEAPVVLKAADLIRVASIVRIVQDEPRVDHL